MKMAITALTDLYHNDKKEFFGFALLGLGMLGMIYALPFVIAYFQ